MEQYNKAVIVQIQDGELFCHLYGKESLPPVIVLHGGPGLGQGYLLPQMAAMGDFSFVHFYDQRGTGKSKSDDTWQLNPLQTYIEDLHQLQKTFQLKTVSLLGHSWGSILASAYASAYPNSVDKLIYVNPVPISNTAYLEFVEHRMQIVNRHKSELDSLRESEAFAKGDPATVEKYYHLYFENYFAKPELANTLTLTMSPEAAIHNFQIYNCFYNYTQQHPFDFYERLKDFNKPTLIVAGDKDVIPLHYQHLLHKALRLSTLTILKNCGHFPYIDAPNRLFKKLKKFILLDP